MNPFTQFLARPLARHRFTRFVNLWDQGERLIIQTFREEGDPRTDREAWRKLRPALHREYPRWCKQLLPFWQQAKLDGKPAQEDPFLALLRVDELADFRDNWVAMQTLPVAREAINRFLLEVLRD